MLPGASHVTWGFACYLGLRMLPGASHVTWELARTAPLAPDQPEFRRLADEIIWNRTSEPIVLHRKYGDASAGRPAGLPAGYTVELGVESQLDIDYTWAVNGRLAQLDAHYPDHYGDGVPVAHWRANYNYGYAGPGQSSDGTLLNSIVKSRVLANGTADLRVQTTYAYDPGRDSLANMTNQRKTAGVWQTLSTHGYQVNELGQRTRHSESAILPAAFGVPANSTWSANRDFLYNARGEVASAATANAVNIPAPVQDENEQFVFDTIGNKKWHRRGDPAPSAPPADNAAPPAGAVSYTSSKANTYSSITGSDRGLTSGAALRYDADGNLLFDGAFLYTWDAENRLVSLKPATPQDGDYDYIFSYDWLSRRRERTVGLHLPNGASVSLYAWEVQKFVYDGWNPVLNIHSYPWDTNFTCVDRYVWGQDVSGTLQGAGGVGGLLFTQQSGWGFWMPWSDTTFLYTFDGNGNVSDVMGGTGDHAWFALPLDGELLAQYRYDAFGRRLPNGVFAGSGLRDTNLVDLELPFTFSTKWEDSTVMEGWAGPGNARTRTLHYYGYRYYWAGVPPR